MDSLRQRRCHHIAYVQVLCRASEAGPGLQARQDVALCFSGGGTRSTTATTDSSFPAALLPILDTGSAPERVLVRINQSPR